MNSYEGEAFYSIMQPYGDYNNPRNCISPGELALINQMRNLWQQHIAWTRTTISSLVFNLPDAGIVAERLEKTATDMGDSLQPYYGELVAHTYGQLLKENVSLAGDLVKALIGRDTVKAGEIERQWHRNADEIAAFLSSINPFIDKENFRKMFYKHLSLIKQQIIYMINYKFQADVSVFDKMVAEGLEMADMLSGGIRKQFYGN